MRAAVSLALPSPSLAITEKAHGKVREGIDDANDVLVSPFSGVVDSKSIWVELSGQTRDPFTLG